MDANGLNPHSLAEATEGRVSDATIRNYLKGGTPTRSRLRAIAEVLGRHWGVRMLVAYGEHAMADELEAMWDRSGGLHAPVEPQYRPRAGLNPEEAQALEILARHLEPAVRELRELFAKNNDR